jgi:hypothetical protein
VALLECNVAISFLRKQRQIGLGEQPVWGNSIKDGLESIAFIGAQEEFMMRYHLMDQQRNTPDVVLGMVDSDGQNGLIALYSLATTQQGIVFRTLDVHFDHRDGGICK